jgi:hypothetical protein
LRATFGVVQLVDVEARGASDGSLVGRWPQASHWASKAAAWGPGELVETNPGGLVTGHPWSGCYLDCVEDRVGPFFVSGKLTMAQAEIIRTGDVPTITDSPGTTNLRAVLGDVANGRKPAVPLRVLLST